jgi:hypothetical protein
MADSTLLKKSRIQPDQRLLVLNAPEGYVDSLGPLPAGVEVLEQSTRKFPFVHVFAKNSSELNALLPTALTALEYDGLFWISYPKKSSKVETDLSRDVFWELLSDTGLRPVTQVSIDSVWSALRFRPTEKVEKRR